MAFRNVYDELEARGFIEQVANPDLLKAKLAEEKLTCYIGFDPTAQSLHVGSLVPLMALNCMQRHGHIPIAILGGGTAMIGDPSGKTEMRQLLSPEKIVDNGRRISAQIANYITLEEGKGRVIDNAEWLLSLQYIDFLREIGRHFSVNRMLAAEAYKQRMESGLSFIEFNYQVLQAYDFLVLFRDHGCILQMGGNDQWGNILAGTELIRRVEGADAFAMTFPLLTTAAGQKMGKTASGAIWLDASLTSPYEFYQYWVNVDDRDVGRFLKLFTVLPMEEVAALAALEGAELREAKRRLAFEVTAFLHGDAAAREAEAGALAAFGGGGDAGAIPETWLDAAAFSADGSMRLIGLLTRCGLAASNGAARRLIRGGGVYVNGERVTDELHEVSPAVFGADGLRLRVGKKTHHRVLLEGGVSAGGGL